MQKYNNFYNLEDFWEKIEKIKYEPIYIQNFLDKEFAIKLYIYISKILKDYYKSHIYYSNLKEKNIFINYFHIQTNYFEWDNPLSDYAKLFFETDSLFIKKLSEKYKQDLFFPKNIQNINIQKYKKWNFLWKHNDFYTSWDLNNKSVRAIACVLHLTINWKESYWWNTYFYKKWWDNLNPIIPWFNNLLLFPVYEDTNHEVSIITKDWVERYAITTWLYKEDFK